MHAKPSLARAMGDTSSDEDAMPPSQPDSAVRSASAAAARAAAGALRNDWLAVAMAAAAELAATLDADAAEGLLDEARIARENVAMLQRYTHLCALLTRYELLELNVGPPLVSFLRFPVHLLPSTMDKFVNGLQSSLVAFVHEVHHAAVTTSVDHLEPSPERLGVGTAEYCNTIAADLWAQTVRVVRREAPEAQARARLQQLLTAFAGRAIDEERARLRELHAHCACLRAACADFGRRRLRGKKEQAPDARRAAARRWLAWAVRGEVGAAVRVLARRRRQARLFEALDAGRLVATLGCGDRHVGDEAAEGLYQCMNGAHVELGTAMNWEVRRIEWLLAAPADHPCWSGLAVAADSCAHAPDERPLQAPAHMACFATGRLRVVADARLGTTAYTCGLALVRVARLLAQLLGDGHLPLHKLGRAFAQRTAVCDFAKYEAAARRVETDSLAPFGRRVGVAYAGGALGSAIRDVLAAAA